MRKKSNTKATDEPREKTPRKTRHSRSFYETANYLDTLGASAEETMLCADALTVWTRFMLASNPSAAGAIYRALNEAWSANRAEADGDEMDRITVLFHAAFLDRLRELRGEERGYGVTRFDRERSASLEKLMASILDRMRARVPQVAAVAGEGGTVDPATEDAPTDAPVVEINLWRQSHPRPVRNLLFAERQD